MFKTKVISSGEEVFVKTLCGQEFKLEGPFQVINIRNQNPSGDARSAPLRFDLKHKFTGETRVNTGPAYIIPAEWVKWPN